MIRAKSYLGALLVCIVSACSEEELSVSEELEQKILVEGYVFANEPIRHIRISRVQGNGEASSIPILNAQVRVNQSGQSWSLELIDSVNGVYGQTDSSAYLQGSGTTELEIFYKGTAYTGASEMPYRIPNLLITDTLIESGVAVPESQATQLSWNPAPSPAGYSIFLRNTNGQISPISSLGAYAGNPLGSSISDTTVVLTYEDFSPFAPGEYFLYVTAINKEFYLFQQEEPAAMPHAASTNISNAWGIFTTFNGREVKIHLQ